MQLSCLTTNNFYPRITQNFADFCFFLHSPAQFAKPFFLFLFPLLYILTNKFFATDLTDYTNILFCFSVLISEISGNLFCFFLAVVVTDNYRYPDQQIFCHRFTQITQIFYFVFLRLSAKSKLFFLIFTNVSVLHHSKSNIHNYSEASISLMVLSIILVGFLLKRLSILLAMIQFTEIAW